MSDDATRMNDYLVHELGRYFPRGPITVDFRDDETIHVDVNGTKLTMEIGSDDSWFTFRFDDAASYENVITIPMPEWLEEI